MTVVVVLSQPLRQKEAAMYLHSRTGVRRVVVTRFSTDVDMAEFPADTEFLTWSPDVRQPPSSRAVTRLSKLKRWIRSGSNLGLRIDRWVRSAEWRLRYLDRLLAMLESRRASHWNLRNPALVELLKVQTSSGDDCEVTVFDVFDLPAVLAFVEDKKCRVAIG
jgi:hypothetical protein